MKILQNQKFKIALALFLLIFSFGVIWALIVPGNNEAPDEASHLNMINFLKTERRIPVFNNEPKIIPTQYNPGLLSGAYYSMAYNSPLSYLPYLLFNKQSSISKPAIFPQRLVSSLFIAGFSLLLFLALCRLKPEKQAAALATTLFISLIPEIIYVAGYINIEPIALFMAALTFYLYTFLRPDQFKNYLYFGLSLAILALMKANYYIFIGYLVLLMLADLTDRLERPQRFQKYLWLLIIFVGLNSWWWWHNWGLYHDPLIISYIKREIVDKAPEWFKSMRDQGYNQITIFTNHYFYQFTFKGFFANLGGANIFLPIYFYWLFYATLIVFVAKAGRVLGESRKYYLSFAIITVAALAYFANKNLDDFSPQGRHLFPLLIPLAVIIFYGLSDIREKFQKWWRLGLPIFALVSSLYGLFLTIDQYYVKGIAYANQSNKAAHLLNFSWWHPSREGFSDLIRLFRLPKYGVGILIVCLIITLLLFSLALMTKPRRFT